MSSCFRALFRQVTGAFEAEANSHHLKCAKFGGSKTFFLFDSSFCVWQKKRQINLSSNSKTLFRMVRMLQILTKTNLKMFCSIAQ